MKIPFEGSVCSFSSMEPQHPSGIFLLLESKSEFLVTASRLETIRERFGLFNPVSTGTSTVSVVS